MFKWLKERRIAKLKRQIYVLEQRAYVEQQADKQYGSSYYTDILLATANKLFELRSRLRQLEPEADPLPEEVQALRKRNAELMAEVQVLNSRLMAQAALSQAGMQRPLSEYAVQQQQAAMLRGMDSGDAPHGFYGGIHPFRFHQ